MLFHADQVPEPLGGRVANKKVNRIDRVGRIAICHVRHKASSEIPVATTAIRRPGKKNPEITRKYGSHGRPLH